MGSGGTMLDRMIIIAWCIWNEPVRHLNCKFFPDIFISSLESTPFFKVSNIRNHHDISTLESIKKLQVVSKIFGWNFGYMWSYHKYCGCPSWLSWKWQCNDVVIMWQMGLSWNSLKTCGVEQHFWFCYIWVMCWRCIIRSFLWDPLDGVLNTHSIGVWKYLWIPV